MIETGRRLIDGWRLDLRHAVRALARDRAFCLTLVGVLGFGIGTVVATYGVVDAYLMQPLPFPRSERLVDLEPAPQVGWDEVDDLFEHPVSWDLDAFTLVGDERPEMVFGSWVTPGFFDAFGIEPVLGRRIREDEAGDGGAAVMMISYGLWQRRYGGDSQVIGRSVAAFTSDRPDDAELFTIIGVLPRSFWFVHRYTDVLAPLRASQPVYTGTLRSGISFRQAEEELTRRSLPRLDEPIPDYRVAVVPMHEAYVAGVRPTLLLLLAGVVLVLVIVCANAGVLILVRAARRERELSVRSALGAGRGRLARQHLTEALILTFAAGALGVASAAVGLGLLGSEIPSRLGVPVPGGVDRLGVGGPVWGLALLLAAGTGLLFGLLPLLGLGRDLAAALASGGREAGGSRARRRARSILVASEIALSLALLVTAGLMVRSSYHLERQQLGFTPRDVTVGLIGLRQASYPELGDRVRLFVELERGLNRLPGVESAGLISPLPFSGPLGPRPLEAAAGESAGVLAEAGVRTASAPYFATLGIPLHRGRLFDDRDSAGGASVALVSEGLAARLWAGADPLGRRLRILPRTVGGMQRGSGEPGPWLEVVGVVGDVRQWLEGGPALDLYLPVTQAASYWTSVAVRMPAGREAARTAVETVLGPLDATIPYSHVMPLADRIDEALGPPHFLAGLLGLFALFALVLAILGLYGVIAYAARQNRREVAIRMTLGADPRTVIAYFLGQGLPVIAIGVVLGLLGARWLSRGLSNQLYGVSAEDPATYAALALLFAAAALIASWLPARRAAASDPARELRAE